MGAYIFHRGLSVLQRLLSPHARRDFQTSELARATGSESARHPLHGCGVRAVAERARGRGLRDEAVTPFAGGRFGALLPSFTRRI